MVLLVELHISSTFYSSCPPPHQLIKDMIRVCAGRALPSSVGTVVSHCFGRIHSLKCQRRRVRYHAGLARCRLWRAPFFFNKPYQR